MKKFKLLIIVAALGFGSTLMAQTQERPWTLGLFGVKTEYLGDLAGNKFSQSGNTIFNFNMNHGGYLGGGLSFSRYLSRFFDLGLYASYSSIGYDYYDEDTQSRRNFKTNALVNGNLFTRIKFLGNDNLCVVPYFTLSVGGLYYDDPSRRVNYDVNGFPTYVVDKDVHLLYNKEKFLDTKGEEVDYLIEGLLSVGFGLEVKLSDALSLRYQADLGWTTADRIDFYVQSEKNDWQLQHSLGLAFSFGSRQKDADGDGVKDKKDLCPNTPAGVAVDVNGCPLDRDGDGVADYLDECPDEAGTINGCPDSDGDGVKDKDDQCSDTPKGVKVDEKGCPIDSDGDGVADYLDKCQNTPANVKVDAAGCPIDTDGDGIPDYLDKCPNEKGTKENQGCPAVAPVVLDGISFDTGKSAIKPTPNPTLDKAISELKANARQKVTISGHTDNKRYDNQKLSEDRANAVKAYLVKGGIDASRITTVGYGDTKPIADNATEAGRAKNRRVEFEVK